MEILGLEHFYQPIILQKNVIFDPNKLKLIEDYPNKTLFAANHNIKYGEIYKFWNLSQKKILKNKK